MVWPEIYETAAKSSNLCEIKIGTVLNTAELVPIIYGNRQMVVSVNNWSRVIEGSLKIFACKVGWSQVFCNRISFYSRKCPVFYSSNLKVSKILQLLTTVTHIWPIVAHSWQ